METVYKNVNVYSGSHPGPLILKEFRAPIVGKVHNIKLSIEDIRICILEKAIVEEIIGTSQTLRLTLFNYASDNSIKTTTTTTVNTVEAPTKATTSADTTTETTTSSASTPATDAKTTTPADTTTTVSASATDKK